MASHLRQNCIFDGFSLLLRFQMKEIALKMDRVDKEFQKKEMVIFQLDSQLQDAHTVIRQLSSKLNDECSRQRRRGHGSTEDFNCQKKQIRDLLELKEFLHVENATLMETVKDSEFEHERLKTIIDKRDEELSKSEEQCRHLVRLSEKRHQEILSVTSKLNSLERKAKEIILNQVKKPYFWTFSPTNHKAVRSIRRKCRTK